MTIWVLTIGNPDPHDLDPHEALATALRGAPLGSHAFVERRHDLRVEFTPDRGAVTSRNRTAGLSVRWGLRRGEYGYVAGSGPEECRKLLFILKQIKESTQSLGAPPAQCVGAVPAAGSGLGPRVPRPIPADRAAGIAMSWALALQRASPQARFQAIWSGFDQRIEVVSPERGLIGDRRRSARMRLDAALRRHGRLSRATAELVYPAHEPPDRPTIEAAAEALATRLEARLDAIVPNPGETVAVLAPGIGGTVMHELLGHCLEGDVDGAASWIRPGEPVGPAELTVLDDPRRGRVPWNVDDEGHPSRPVMLVQRGQASGRIHDWRTAVRAGLSPSGHGRRHSFNARVQPRMGCTFVAAGAHDPHEILRDVERGIFVRRLESASVDVRSGRATFRVTDADTIQGGAIGAPIERCSLTIDGRTGLRSIDRIGHDLQFDPCIGNCLKDGQPLATSVGAPTIRLGVAEVHN